MADSSKRTARKPAALSPARAAAARRASVKASATSSAAQPGPAKPGSETKGTRQTAANQTAANQTRATKAPSKNASANRTAANRTVAKKTPTTKTPALASVTDDKPTPRRRVAHGAPVRKPTVRASASTPSTQQKKKDPVTVDTAPSTPERRFVPSAPDAWPVRPGEDAWTEDEVAELVAELESDVARQRAQIAIVDSELAGLLRDGNDGAGRDPADVGSTNFERDQEMSIAANSRGVLDQSVEALHRIRDGRFGICASCGQPVGKGRLQAFPRAVLCVTCKQREERR